MSGQVRQCLVILVQVSSITHQVRSGQGCAVSWGQVMSDQVRIGQVRLERLKVKLGQVRSGKVQSKGRSRKDR